MSYIGFNGYCRKYFLKDRRPSLCFKNGLTLNSIKLLAFSEMFRFLKIEGFQGHKRGY